MKKIAVLTSGGDAPGMNAAIRAVVRTAVFHELDVCGVFQGFQGLVDGDFKKLHVRSVAKILGRGGTILKSARCNEFRTKELERKNSLVFYGILWFLQTPFFWKFFSRI